MKSFFQIEVSDEQIEYTTKIVNYSLEHHKIPNMWDIDKSKKDNTFFYRFIGSLGEVVFADVYGLPRHEKSFGAEDGQDNGNDFLMNIDGSNCILDIKSMHRKNDIFYGNYVLNIPSTQLNKPSSVTDYYFSISIHQSNNRFYASFLGLINKQDVLAGKIGTLYKAGTSRIRGDKTTFRFTHDTYEVLFKDFEKPEITERIRAYKGFKLININ